jgi:trehalose/maltose hydrolase-like predicted phosphorylase
MLTCLTALLLCSGPHQAVAGSDPTFLLSTELPAAESYFPTYLANGYVSTMSSPRGTEGNPSFVVGLMDYSQHDIARPAAIPGWSEINYSADAAGQSWLNQTKLSAKAFEAYQQTLDMYDATLRTRYRYTDDSARSTFIDVITLVSQSSPHLAATQMTITPQFTGTVRLSFTFTLWAPHQPRFALAELTAEQLKQALAANGRDLIEPVNQVSADRAPIWYHGDTQIVDDGGEARDLTLWLNARAEQGLTLSEAAAIALPPNVQSTDVRVEKSPYQLSIVVTLSVEKGRSYIFGKYVAVSRQGWGADARESMERVKAAREQGFDVLLEDHRNAWHELWRTDIRVDGEANVQRALHSDLYYILSNSTVGTAWPVAACGLTPNYAGHTFWDSDSWVFPVLLLLHPERAKPLVEFRRRTLEAAEDRARQYGGRGALYPWEADPETGVDYTPHFADGVSREIHIDADVAIAQWQYYQASGDRDWLRRSGWPVIKAIAQFWASRVWFNAATKRYEILHVTSPDEAYDDVPNDSFTNASARKALHIATRAARVVGVKADPRWGEIARQLYIPFSSSEQRHLDFDSKVPHDKVTWMGSSVSWLAYPNLDLPMSSQVRRNDFDFQLRELQVHGNDPNEMMMTMLAVHAAELGDAAAAGTWIDRNLPGFLKPPFNVRSETVANNAGYLLASSAGFVQSILYGLTGLRLADRGLKPVYPAVLPDGWTSLRLENITYRGHRYDVVVWRGVGRVRMRIIPTARRRR